MGEYSENYMSHINSFTLCPCESVSLSVLHIVKCSFDDGGPLVMMTMMLHSSGIGRLAVRGSHVESTRESREFVSAIQGR